MQTIEQNIKKDKELFFEKYFIEVNFKPIIQNIVIDKFDLLETDYVEEYGGEIIAINKDSCDDDDMKEVIGKVKYYLINSERIMNAHTSLSEIMENHSHEVFDIYQNLFNYGSYDLKVKVEKEIGDLMGSNFVVLSNLEILPEFRGNGIGKLIIKNGLEFFTGKADLFVLKSFPKQMELFDNSDSWRNKMGYSSMNLRDAQKSLDKYYISCGLNKLKSYKFEGSILYKNMMYT